MTTHLGDEHPLVTTLTESLEEAKKKFEKPIARQEQIKSKSKQRQVQGYDYQAIGRGLKNKTQPPLTHQVSFLASFPLAIKRMILGTNAMIAATLVQELMLLSTVGDQQGVIENQNDSGGEGSD